MTAIDFVRRVETLEDEAGGINASELREKLIEQAVMSVAFNMFSREEIYQLSHEVFDGAGGPLWDRLMEYVDTFHGENEERLAAMSLEQLEDLTLGYAMDEPRRKRYLEQYGKLIPLSKEAVLGALFPRQ